MSGSFYSDRRKVDPGRRRPDGSPDDNDRIEIGPTAEAFALWADKGIEAPNLEKMRRYRYERVLQEVRQRGLAGVLMFDPLNIRYATDSTNMQLWITHNQSRAALVLADGTMILFDYHTTSFLSDHLPLVTEVRPITAFYYFVAGDQSALRADKFAASIAAEVRHHGEGSRVLAVDRTNHLGFDALRAQGLEIVQGEAVMEHARKIKSAEEIKAIRCAIAACDHALDRMRGAMQPGISENALWAELHAGNIAFGGEWIETRLLASGQRTNPWFQECGPRIIEEGDLVAFDTDLVGCYGYCVDISRTWICGDRLPTNEQKALYQIAYDHIQENTRAIRPGMTLKEATYACKRLPEEYRARQYGVMFHGVGLCDEYPEIMYQEAWEEDAGYGGTVEVGMVLCVEAYVGAVGGKQGVKLENQLLMTEHGAEVLSHYPFESAFLD